MAAPGWALFPTVLGLSHLDPDTACRNSVGCQMPGCLAGTGNALPTLTCGHWICPGCRRTTACVLCRRALQVAMALRARWRWAWVLTKIIVEGMLRLTKTKGPPKVLPLQVWAKLVADAGGVLPDIMDIPDVADVNGDRMEAPESGSDSDGNGDGPSSDDDDDDGGAGGRGSGKAVLMLTRAECLRLCSGDSLDAIRHGPRAKKRAAPGLPPPAHAAAAVAGLTPPLLASDYSSTGSRHGPVSRAPHTEPNALPPRDSIFDLDADGLRSEMRSSYRLLPLAVRQAAQRELVRLSNPDNAGASVDVDAGKPTRSNAGKRARHS